MYIEDGRMKKMIVKVKMDDEYTFHVLLDIEAIELLHQLSAIRKEKATDVIQRLVLGGLVLMQTVNKQGKYERNKKRKGGRISLLFKHFLHLK